MSQAFRARPRWSVEAQPEPPASIAGLPFSRASVAVGPPLLRSWLSSSGLAFRSPGPVKPQLVPLSRLCPTLAIGGGVVFPAQFGPSVRTVLPEMIVLLTLTPAPFAQMPPPFPARFPLIVSFTSVVVGPALQIAPPWPVAEPALLPKNVEFVTVSVPALMWIAPPSPVG